MAVSIDKRFGYYPFLDSVKKSIGDALNNEVDTSLVESAKNRTLSAIKYGRTQTPLYISDEDVINDVRTYALSRVLISLVGMHIDKFVDSECKRALSICFKNGDTGFLLNELGIDVHNDTIPLHQYLKYVSSFSSMQLVNKPVSNGYVKVREYEINVVLREAIKSKIRKGLPIRESLISDDLKQMLSDVVKEIRSEISARSPALGRMSKDIAPCMEKVIEDLKNGSNVPHLKRWSLAVFLVKRGWNIDKIVSVYANSPKFDEKMTRYQIEHIKSRGYSMPSCSTLRSQGICVSNCGIKNPLQYKKKG